MTSEPPNAKQLFNFRTKLASGFDTLIETTDEIKNVRVHERLQETKEASSCPKDKIFPHRARIFPVSEPYAIMVWPTTEEQDHSQEQERDDGNDLDTCEYEFRFSVSFDNCRQPTIRTAESNG